MKKLTALLFACMMIASTFTACGDKDDDDDSSSKKKNKTTSTASVDDDDDDEDETEPTTKKKKPTTTEASTDEDETEPTTSKKKPVTTEADEEPTESSGKVDSKILGKWNTTENGFSGSYVFDANGKGSVYLDATSMYHFKGDKLVINDIEFGSDEYEFDGTNLKFEQNGMEYFTMKKTKGSKDSLDGTYNVVSGYFYDAFEDQYDNTDTYSLDMIVDGETLFLCMNDCFTYTADGKKLKFIEGAELMNNEEITYTIMGTKMTFSAGGTKQVLTKD